MASRQIHLHHRQARGAPMSRVVRALRDVLRVPRSVRADVALDSVGGETWRRNLDVLAPFGRLVSFGNAAGEQPWTAQFSALTPNAAGAVTASRFGGPLSLRAVGGVSRNARPRVRSDRFGLVATLFGDPERYAAGLTQTAPGVHAWLQPNGAWGESNAGLVVGEGESLLVDTLWDLDLTAKMLAAMGPLVRDAPIRTLLNTHGDGDHWWGNELVGASAIVATEAAAAHEMKAVTPGSMAALRRLGSALALAGRMPIPRSPRGSLVSTGRFLEGMAGPFDHRAIALTRPTRTFSGRLDLDVGGRKVELIQVGPAHTHGDLIVHVPDARVVFAADVVFIGSTPVMWAGPLEGWLRALDTIEALEPMVVVPGHGPITDLAGLAGLRAYWAYLDAAARRRLADGKAPAAVAREVVLSDEYAAQPFAGWDCPERAVINVHTLARHRCGGPEPRGPAVVAILGAVGRLAAELPGRAPAALHPPV